MIVAVAVDLGNVLIKFSATRAPSALLEAVGGIRAIALLAVKHDRANNLIARGRDEGHEGRRLCRTRDHDQIIFRIVAHFIGSVVPPTEIGFATPPGNVFTLASVLSTQTCPGPRPGHRSAESALSPTQISVWLLTVNTPSGPEVSLLPVKPCESCVDDLREGRGGGRQIEDVDRLIAAVSQEVLVEHRIDPADVERKEGVRELVLGDFQSRCCLVQ